MKACCSMSTTSSGYKEYAGFADVTVHLTPRFDIQAGGRSVTILRKYHSLTAIPPEPKSFSGRRPISGRTPATSAFTSGESGFKIAPELLVYARLSTGYRPGGPNAGDFEREHAAHLQVGQDDKLRAGPKGTLLDRGCHSIWLPTRWTGKDIQLAFHDENTGFLFLRNASKASAGESSGSFEFRPGKTLQISATLVQQCEAGIRSACRGLLRGRWRRAAERAPIQWYLGS